MAGRVEVGGSEALYSRTKDRSEWRRMKLWEADSGLFGMPILKSCVGRLAIGHGNVGASEHRSIGVRSIGNRKNGQILAAGRR